MVSCDVWYTVYFGNVPGTMFWFWLQPVTKAPRGSPYPCWGAEENGRKEAETGGSG